MNSLSTSDCQQIQGGHGFGLGLGLGDGSFFIFEYPILLIESVIYLMLTTAVYPLEVMSNITTSTIQASYC